MAIAERLLPSRGTKLNVPSHESPVATDRVLKFVPAYFLEGQPKYVLSRGDCIPMVIPDEIRQCVAFAGYRSKKTGNDRIGATVFFVSVPTPNCVQAYVVTAKHVIDDICRDAIDPTTMFLQLNTKSDGVMQVSMAMSDWRFHEDPTIDVAVAEFEYIEGIDHQWYPLSSALTTENSRRAQGIGIGTELFLAGLFTSFQPRNRNVPILRVGHIAAMPEEPVPTRYGSMQAYLVESRSIGGLSGSPVFAYLQRNYFFLLGVMHGHFATTDLTVDGERINSGIAAVVPIEKIMDIVNCEEFGEQRRELQDKYQRAQETIPDANKPPP